MMKSFYRSILPYLILSSKTSVSAFHPTAHSRHGSLVVHVRHGASYVVSSSATLLLMPFASSDDTKTTRISYDLGLGRNPPVMNQSSTTQEVVGGWNPSSDHWKKHVVSKSSSSSSSFVRAWQPPKSSLGIVDETRYLVEFESVHREQHVEIRKYTSPNTSPMDASNNNNKNNPRIRSKPIFPFRGTDNDTLRIIDVATDHNPAVSGSVAIAQTPHRNYELDTPWVEMLIHEQQAKWERSQA